MLLIRRIQEACQVRYLILKQYILNFHSQQCILKYHKIKLKFFVKDFAKMPKLNQFSPAINCVKHSRTKNFIQVFSVQGLIINLFLIAAKLVMSVKHTNISQPGLINTLVRIISHMLVHLIVFYSRYCKDKVSVTHERKFVDQLIKTNFKQTKVIPKHNFNLSI